MVDIRPQDKNRTRKASREGDNHLVLDFRLAARA